MHSKPVNPSLLARAGRSYASPCRVFRGIGPFDAIQTPPWAPAHPSIIFDYTSAQLNSLINGGRFNVTDPSVPSHPGPPLPLVEFASGGDYAAGGTFSIYVPNTPPFPAVADLNLTAPSWLTVSLYTDGAYIRGTVEAAANAGGDRFGDVVIQFTGKVGANPKAIFTASIAVKQHEYPY